MSNALNEHDGKVSISGSNITNLLFADDTDALAEEEQEVEALMKVSTKPAQDIKWKSVPRRPKSRQNLHKILNGNQCREDQTDDKQRQWHPHRDKGKRAKVGHCNKLQLPLSS